MKRILFIGLILLMLCGVAGAYTVGNFTYNYRQQFTIVNDSTWAANITADPVRLDVYSGSGTSTTGVVYLNSHASNFVNWGDIRVTDLSGNIFPQRIYLENSNATHIQLDVNVSPISKTANTSGYVYYGNASVGAYSNGETTYQFYDDFGIWKRYGNITNLTADTWGPNPSAGALEPNVIYETNPQILVGNTYVYKMWYSTAFVNGTSPYTGYAESLDGLTNWSLYGKVIDGYNRGCVVKVNGTYYFYGAPVGDTHIGVFTSTNGVTNWTYQGIAIALGAGGAWDDAHVANSNVWTQDNITDWKMLYDAGRMDSPFKVGLATSTNGINWTKSASNPVITTTNTVGGPSPVFKIGSTYWVWMIYAVGSFLPTDIMRYSSQDLITWATTPNSTTFYRADAWEGVGATSGGQVADPYLLTLPNGNMRLYYAATNTGNGPSYYFTVRAADINLTPTNLVTTNEDQFNTTSKWNIQAGTGISIDVVNSTGVINSASTQLNQLFSRKIFGNNYTFTTRDKSLHNASASYTELFSLATPTNTRQIYAEYSETSTLAGKYRNYDGTNIGATYNILGWSADTFHNHTLIRHSTADWWVDGSNNVVVGGSGYPTDSLYLQYSTYEAGSKITVDYIQVEDYVSPEPVISVWGVEETDVSTPVANFTANTTTGTSPLNVSFTDSSTNTPTSWYWEFGDGNTSTSQNPTHVYYTGNWSVNMSATNSAGTDWFNGTWINVTAGSTPSTNLNASYTYNVTHYINGSSSGTLTNYPISLVMFNTSGTSSGENLYEGGAYTQADWDDVRFSQDGTTALPMWLENTSINATSARFWVNMSTITGGTTNQTPLYCYFGNASAGSGINGTATFQLFDHFDGASVNTSMWDLSNANTTTSSSLLTVNNTADLRSNKTFSTNFSIESYIIPKHGAVDWWRWQFGIINVEVTLVDGFFGGDGLINKLRVYANSTYVSQYSPTYSNTTFYRFVFQRTPTRNITGSINTDSISATNATVSSGFRGRYSTTGTTEAIVSDWIFVRQYVAQEPTHSTYVNGTVVPPVANFTPNATTGASPLNVSFTDSSTNTPTSWNWSFGDGNYSEIQNPNHVFYTGNWSVNLSATNSAGTGYKNGTWINVTSGVVAPVSTFSTNKTSGKIPLSIQFNDTSLNTPTSWLWQWGDGTANVTTQNPVHTFTDAGAYTVNLTATNAGGSSTSPNTTITAQALVPPTAGFSANTTVGNPGAYILFTDSSSESPTSWQWSFGDLTANSTDQNPVHQYANVGTYTVILTAFNADGNNTFARVNYITISATPTPPTAAFSANATTGVVPKTIQFADASTNSPTSWNWTFGDSNTSTDQNPTHTYVLAGTYDVKLQVTNSDGTDWENKTGYLTFTNPATPTPTPTPAMVPPIASFGCNRTYVYDPVPSGCQFYDNSLNNPTSWLWDFGDGNTSTEQSPNHTYQPGYYTVSLTSTNAFGSTTDTQKDYIHIRTSYARTTVAPTHTITTVSTHAYNQMIEAFGANRSPTTEEEARINWTTLLSGVTYTFTDLMGALFFVILFAIFFVPLWLMQKDLTLPGIVGIILGGFAFMFIPVEWHLGIITFIAMSIVAVIYGLMKDRG